MWNGKVMIVILTVGLIKKISFYKKLFSRSWIIFAKIGICNKVVEKSNKENLKVIKNTLPNKSGNPEKTLKK